MEEFFGYDRSELLVMQVNDLLLPHGDQGTARIEHLALLKNGQKVHVETSESAFQTDNGLLMVRTLRDVSWIKETQVQLANTRQLVEEANRTKSNFLANMSHEIRTPMNSIVGLTHLVLAGQVGQKERGYLTKIQSAAHDLLAIMNDILDFSKINSGTAQVDITEFNIGKLFLQLSSTLSAKVGDDGPELIFRVDPHVPRFLQGDPQKLLQVLLNLGSNAVKFTQKGEVLIACVMAGDEGDRVRLTFSVTDTGIGMNQEQLEKLFKPFTQGDASITRSYGGTGLGLILSQELTRMMGGEIDVKSSLGQGSCFSMSLSFKKGRSKATLMPVMDKKFFAELTVLVVDDNNTVGEILVQYLRAFGCVVHYVDSEAKTTDFVMQQEVSPALVFLDWRMAHMGGPERLDQIIAPFRERKTAIIVMIDNGDKLFMAQLAQSLGIAAILVKPISPSSLLDAMLKVVDKVGPLSAALTEPMASPKIECRVLLVEDNDLNRQMASDLLAAIGMTVVTSQNGQEAIDILECQPFDMVLMDIQMPGMDGYTTTQRIRQDQRFKDLTIIAMTAHAFDSDRCKALAAGMNDHIAKPIDVNQLYTLIERWLSNRALSSHDTLSPYQTHYLSYREETMPVNFEIGLKYCAGNKGLYQRLVQKFLDREKDVVYRLKASILEGDRESAIRLVHTMKSSSMTLGATSLGEIAARLEAFWKNDGELSDTLADLVVFEERLNLVLDYLATHHAAEAPTPGQKLYALEHYASQIEILKKLMAEFDAEAVSVAKTFVDGFNGTSLAPLAQRMLTKIKEYDFDQAMTILDDVVSSLTVLGKTK